MPHPTFGHGMIERLSGRIHFAVFGPDLSYDDGLPAETDGAFLKVPVSGGKLLAAYSIRLPSTGGYDEQPEYTTRFARYLPDGTRDRTFGKNGRLEVGQTAQVKIVPGEGILVVPEYQPVVRSYTLNGRVDTAYGGDGEISVPLSIKLGNGALSDGTRIVHVQSDGKVLVQSQIAIVPHDSDIQHRYDVARLNTDGSLDTSFGRQGYLSFRQDRGNANVIVTPRALYVHSDYLGSTSPPSGELIQYTLNGKAADGSFGGDGRVAIPGFVNAITEQPDGKLLFIEASYVHDPVLYRIKRDGTRDSAFSGDGKITLSYDDSAGSGDAAREGVSLRLDGQNRIVVSAVGTIFRFNANGTLNSYPFNGSAPFPTRIATLDDQDGVIGTDGRRYGLVTPQQLDADGVVQITTDRADDRVTVADAGGGKVRVIVNGQSRLFRARDVRGFNMNLFDGDVDLHVSVDRPVTLRAGQGNDTIVTAGGDDDIKVGSGDHDVDLGGGNDSVEIGNVIRTDVDDRQRVVGSGGNKSVEVLSGSATIDLSAGDHHVRALGDAQQIRVVIAGGNNDLYLSGQRNDVTIGGSGKNDVTAFGARDSIVTGEGSDTILAISAQGTFRTGGGDDRVTIRNFSRNPTTGSTVYAGAGDDHVFCDKTYFSLATVYGGSGDDRLDGWSLSQRLYGEAGRDTLSGQDGNDFLYGGDGDDLIIGGASSDRLYGDAGNDRLYGQFGNDTLYGGADNDRLFAQTGSDRLFGDGGNDRLYADDAAGHYVLHGGAERDLFFTRNGSQDTVYGDGGDDSAEADDDDLLDGVARV